MAKLSPEEAHQKWVNRLTNAIPDVKKGIDRVTESPTEAAAKSVDKWFAGLQKARSTGKYERGLRGVSLEEWKSKARDVGADRIGTGAVAAHDKQVNFYGKLFPYQDSLQRRVKAMPNTSLQDNIQRAVAWIQGMSEFDKTK